MGMVTIVMLGKTINVAIASASILCLGPQVAGSVMLYFAGLIMVGHTLNTAAQNLDDQPVAIDIRVTLYREMLQLSKMIHIHHMVCEM